MTVSNNKKSQTCCSSEFSGDRVVRPIVVGVDAGRRVHPDGLRVAERTRDPVAAGSAIAALKND